MSSEITNEPCPWDGAVAKSMTEDVSWEKNARDRFLSVYGATIAVQWAAHVREGRGLDEGSIRSFISEARALAQWTEEVQNV